MNVEREETVLEVERHGEYHTVGGCVGVRFEGTDVFIKSLSLFYRPVPSLGGFNASKWLARQSLILTRVRVTETSHSTYSWHCLYKECAGMEDFTDFSMFSDVRLEIGRIRE